MKRRAVEIARFARSGSPASRLYDAVCSNRRVLVSPTLYKYTTITDQAKREMAERAAGVRLFTSRDSRASLASRTSRGQRVPSPCALESTTLGRATMSQVPRDILACGATFAGNWTVMLEVPEGGVRRTTPRKDRFMTVCGFFDCGSGALLERYVKHVNLCEYGRSVAPEGKALMYLFSGTFVAGRRKDGAIRVFVNARSGTWAMAKRVLALSGHEIGDADDAVVQFARPRVARVIRKAIGSFSLGAGPLPGPPRAKP